jgi:hypothetical protein
MDSSASPETDATSKPPSRPDLQFSLRTLLLLFVVLGSSLAVFGAWGIVVFGLVVGLAIYVHRVESLASLVHLVLVVLCLMCLIGPVLSTPMSVHEAARRAVCANNLHEIAAALQAYHRVNGRFPPACIADKNGKVMHSWRVLLLPFLDSDVTLYQAYKFSESWDGPNNTKLAVPVPIYDCPSNGRSWMTPPFETSYVALVGPKGEWPSEKAASAADGSRNDTIMVVEVANSGIPWMEPRDLSINALDATEVESSALTPSSKHDPQSGFFLTYDHSGFHAAMADGSVRFLPPGTLSKASMVRLNWPNIAALAVWLLSVGTLLTLAVRSRNVGSVPPSPS